MANNETGQWATDEALTKIKLGLALGVLIALFVVYFAGYGAGYKKGAHEGYDQGWHEGYEKGTQDGEAIGKAKAEKYAYIQGYEDKTYGLPSQAEEKEWQQLAENRRSSKSTYLYIASLLAILFIFYWLPFIYLKDADSKESFPSWIHLRTVFEKLGNEPHDKAYRYGFISKVLFSVILLIMSWIFLSGHSLANISSNYINRIPNELLVISTGVLFSGLLVFLIELLTTRIESSSIKFWGQILWAGIFSMLLYQFLGSLAATHSVNAESAIKMLVFQAGMSIGMAIYLFSWFSYKGFSKLRSRQVIQRLNP